QNETVHVGRCTAHHPTLALCFLLRFQYFLYQGKTAHTQQQ
ncbi:hypothetical protein D030_2540B, partial [Vibrio parahaemolyticus AQ3810]